MRQNTKIVAITGASGAIYGLRLIQELLDRGDDVVVLISPSGFLVLEHETNLRLKGGRFKIEKWLKKYFGKAKGRITYCPAEDISSFLSSGSSFVRDMIVCPCSMGTLARISCGISGNLIERAADVALKERGRLILVPRETPLSQIHLGNMLKLSKMGAHIIPAMPGFYHQPKKIEDLVDFVVGKILDAMGIENRLYKRWDGEK
ncbi:MAG: UbiX family flavin prenyltransferase [Deltaproteobacteria bacterium]|nr:UbiX family flavin prenyltransferase [Deltaproteobacteria bacterium]